MTKNIFQRDIKELLDEMKARLRKDGQPINADAEAVLEKRIQDVLNYHPKIGILGKTGSGKSSLCNAIFGSDAAKIDDVKGCTRAPQEILIKFGENKSITLVDMPGVGESIERDAEYRAMYKSLLPQLDLVVWVVKADDRALTVDQLVVMQDLKPMLSGTPFIVAINQVDKLNPLREWDAEKNKPGVRQMASINEKTKLVADFFGLTLDLVIAVSAEEKYNLTKLVEGMVFAIPDSKKVGFFREVKQEYKSEKAEEEVKRGFIATILGVVEKSKELYKKIEPYIPTIIEYGTKLLSLLKKYST